MKRIFALASLCLSCAITGQAQAPVLSAGAEIAVVTMGPSQEELYSAFGHSGIRVYDSIRHFDVFFNYGVFNFNQPHFYLNFARGNLNYMVDAYEYQDNFNYYVAHHRFIHEQWLDLTLQQKQRLFDFLWWNVQPANQGYRYDYFYNNCATKIRDVFTSVLKQDVRFDSSYIQTHYTIRQLTDLYLAAQPWGDLGIDICLGLPMDKKARPYEYMFLPDYIESSFDHAYNTTLGVPLVKKKFIAYQPAPEVTPFSWTHPWIVFGLVLALGTWITWRDWQRKKASGWFDIPFFLVLGLLGILLLLLWTMTDHKAAANNFNLLWALPTHAVAAWALAIRGNPRWLKSYFIITAVVSALVLAFWSVLPQALNTFLMPLVALVLLRSLLISKLR